MGVIVLASLVARTSAMGVWGRVALKSEYHAKTDQAQQARSRYRADRRHHRLGCGTDLRELLRSPGGM